MGAKSIIKDLLSRSSSFEATLQNPFLHFDAQGAARELRLKERGAENGGHELPASDALMPDAVETEITSRVSRAWQQACSEAERWFYANDQRISNLSLLTQLPTIASAAIQTETEIRAAVVQATLRLTTARDAVTQSYAQLRAFQREHGLNRPAKLVQTPSVIYGGIFLALIAETTGNSVLLRENDDLGLLGGIAAALILGVINIFVAVLMGRLVFPRTNLKPPARYPYVLFSSLWVVFLLVWNLFGAHYRDAKVAGVERPEFAAAGMMASPPASIYSWALLILGMVFAIVAAISAYGLSDPYPGYSTVWREHEARCADYAAEVQSVSEEINDLHSSTSQDFADLRTKLAQQLADQSRALNGRNAFIQKLNRYHGELQQAGEYLLATYRDANKGARKTAPPPSFEMGFTLPPPDIPAAPPAAVSADDVAREDGQLGNAQRQISDAFIKGVESFETLEALKARLPS